MMQQYVNQKIEELKEEVMKSQKKLEQKLNGKITDIYLDHLLEDNFIGPGSECEYKSLRSYVRHILPKVEKSSKKSEEEITQIKF